MLSVEKPVEFVESVVLPDERHVRIRHLRRGEEHAIRELWEHLSPRSRYLRFLSTASTVPDSLAGSLAAVDNHRRMALVAERDAGSAVEILGLANFVAVNADTAEVGLVVRDDWQRRRVGTELAFNVLLAAERRGFGRFVGHVSADNAPMRGLLAKVAVVVSSTVSRGLCEIAFVRSRR